jgi:hypothetical protein
MFTPFSRAGIIICESDTYGCQRQFVDEQQLGSPGAQLQTIIDGPDAGIHHTADFADCQKTAPRPHG